MIRRTLLAALPLLIIVLIPLLLRRSGVRDNPAADQLVIVSPHNEAIRYEFESAFCRAYRLKHGRDVDIDWRTPGGTSEIVRYINSEYTARFRHFWAGQGRPWTADVQASVLSHKAKEKDVTPEAWQARQAFLASEVGIDVDLFFGGGQYDFGRMAAQGILVPCGVRTRHPELFTGAEPLLVPGLSGEVWYDGDDRYYGACLAAFGICFNTDRCTALGVDGTRVPWPSRWEELGDPRYFGNVGAGDPSKSGSITKAFEMLIQQQMAKTVAAGKSDGAAAKAPPEALARGWDEAMLLIRRIGANAKYFTFSAGKVPVDVANGDVALGMCIDFYGSSQAEWHALHTGSAAVRYVTPEGGSSVSADPIGLLRGAPRPDTAREFIDFVLSREGQQLWDFRPGTPGGPERYALRRLPVRRDLYTAADRQCMSDPDARPFALAQEFEYHPDWTAPLFGLIGTFVKVMVIDCHDELRGAWAAIIAAGGPEANPDAMARLRALPFTYAQARDVAQQLSQARGRLSLTREWATFFRQAYTGARTAAEQRTALAADH